MEKNFKSIRADNKEIEEKNYRLKKKFLKMSMIVKWCLRETVIILFL